MNRLGYSKTLAMENDDDNGCSVSERRTSE